MSVDVSDMFRHGHTVSQGEFNQMDQFVMSPFQPQVVLNITFQFQIYDRCQASLKS
jgi:hypothetical protein